MTLQAYLHGYSPQEQLRLVEQAEYWKETILSDLPYKPGESLLDVGCGVGAVLGVIAAAHQLFRSPASIWSPGKLLPPRNISALSELFVQICEPVTLLLFLGRIIRSIMLT